MERAEVIPNIPLKRSLLSQLPMRMETAIRTTNDTDECQLSPKRRRRTTISTEQLQKLEALYDQGQWPNRAAKEALATEMNKSTNFVNVWFQNKRSRVRKALLEERGLAAAKERLTSSDKVIKNYRDVPIAPKPPYQYQLSRSLNTGSALPPLREDLYGAVDFSNQYKKRNLVQATFSENVNKYRSLYSTSPISIDNQLHYETTDRQPAWFECVREERPRMHHSHLIADVDYINCLSQGRNDVLTTHSYQHPYYPSISTSHHPDSIFQKKTNLSTSDDRGVHRQEAGCLLHTLLYMMMIEGGHWKLIQDKRDAQLAIDACLYGLKLRDGKTLIIDKDCGFGIKDDEEEDTEITPNMINTPQ